VDLRSLLDNGDSDRVALRKPGGFDVAYDGLRGTVDALAAEFAHRAIVPGDRVAMTFINGPLIVEAFFGVAAARAGAAPLNPAYTRDEFAFYLEDLQPKMLLVAPGESTAARDAAQVLGIAVVELSSNQSGLVFIDGEPLDFAAPRAQPQADDVALLLHTSGTTSRPKGVPLTHHNLCTSAQNIARWYGIGPDDVSLCVMPLFHVHGLVFSTLATLFAGALEIVPERFSAHAFWPLVCDNDATIVSAVPTIYRTLLLRAGDDGVPAAGEHRLRFMRSSSSALPVQMLHDLHSRFGVAIIEAYSMTEAAHQMTANPLDGSHRPGSVGIGAAVEIAIMASDGQLLATGETGEVVIRGENVTSGYLNNPDANAVAFTNGWFRTGDSGKLDAEGFLTLEGRIKELINRGGEKISPVEIDAVLLSHPAVREAVTFGIPDEKYGEVVAAAVVLGGDATADDLRAYLAERLAAFKVPSVFHIVDEIPKTATGKVQRRVVAAAFSAKEASA